MKKYLPILLFVLGLIVVVAAIFLVLKKGGSKTNNQGGQVEETIPEVPFEKRPFTSLTPSADGHWLKLAVDGINIDSETLDYELLYKVKDGRTQGVPGTIKLAGQSSLTRDLLLGSESSGKFRYDEGVEEGTLTLRFRSANGKVVAKFQTRFHLQTGVSKINTIDDSFSYTLSKSTKGVFFVTMETFGVKGRPESMPNSKGPYGIFASTGGQYSGTSEPTDNVYILEDGEWKLLEGGKSTNVGVFLVTS